MKILKLELSRPRMAADSPLRFALAAVLLLTLSIALVTPVLADEEPPAFLAKWGSRVGGRRRVQPSQRRGDRPRTGVLYVADKDNFRIQKFDGSSGPRSWQGGSSGAGDGQLRLGPYGVAVDTAGNVFTVERFDTQRVQKFTTIRTRSLRVCPEVGLARSGRGQFTGRPISQSTQTATSTWQTSKQPHPEV